MPNGIGIDNRVARKHRQNPPPLELLLQQRLRREAVDPARPRIDDLDRPRLLVQVGGPSGAACVLNTD